MKSSFNVYTFRRSYVKFVSGFIVYIIIQRSHSRFLSQAAIGSYN